MGESYNHTKPQKMNKYKPKYYHNAIHYQPTVSSLNLLKVQCSSLNHPTAVPFGRESLVLRVEDGIARAYSMRPSGDTFGSFRLASRACTAAIGPSMFSWSCARNKGRTWAAEGVEEGGGANGEDECVSRRLWRRWWCYYMYIGLLWVLYSSRLACVRILFYKVFVIRDTDFG